MSTIVLLFTCRLCGLTDARVEVRARADGEDVKAWLDDVVATGVQPFHLARSPGCPNPQIDKLKIPITGAPRIGGSVES